MPGRGGRPKIPGGVTDGLPTLDGEGVIWFEDESGDEAGAWVVQPFHGGETRPFLTGVPYRWSSGLAVATTPHSMASGHGAPRPPA